MFSSIFLSFFTFLLNIRSFHSLYTKNKFIDKSWKTLKIYKTFQLFQFLIRQNLLIPPLVFYPLMS